MHGQRELLTVRGLAIIFVTFALLLGPTLARASDLEAPGSRQEGALSGVLEAADWIWTALVRYFDPGFSEMRASTKSAEPTTSSPDGENEFDVSPSNGAFVDPNG